MAHVGAVVVGAGVVGAAAARSLARAGLEVLAVDRFRQAGQGTTSRNSQVIHAGLYYPDGSLKARFCAASAARLYKFAESRHIPHWNCQKLVVAAEGQEERLKTVAEHARSIGCLQKENMRMLSRHDLKVLEPDLVASAAILSPGTGVICAHSVVSALLAEAEASGADFSFGSDVEDVSWDGNAFTLTFSDGFKVTCDKLINAAGLHAGQLAETFVEPRLLPKFRFCKGNYFRPTVPVPFQRLIYPLPPPSGAGLGTHLTLDVEGGGAKFGPDTEWLPDDYAPVKDMDGSGVYNVDASRAASFEESIQCWWPSLPSGSLAPDYSGLRVKVPSGDFEITSHGMEGYCGLYGIESPGLTSSLMIADQVLRVLGVPIPAEAQEDELERPPPGTRCFSDGLRTLLQGEASESVLEALKQRREEVRKDVEAAAVRWGQAADARLRSACAEPVPSFPGRLSSAAALLEEHRAATGGALKGVFDRLQGFQRLLARRRCLEDIVSMVKKTDAVREAVFACRPAEELPVAEMAEVVTLCSRLPSRSRAVGVKRARFLTEPLRSALSQALLSALRETGTWPKEPGTSVQPGGDAREKVLRLCRRLSQLQESARDLRQLEGSELSPAEDSVSWPCQALATPLVARFRHHFCRPDSELCRTDKPEWAFRYLVEMASDHATELEGWLAQLRAEDCRSMVAGLVAALATEGRRFVAGRLRALSEDEVAKPWLLQTLHQLVRFHSALVGLGGTAAAQALMADFDGNVLLAPGEPSEEPGDSPSEPAQRGALAEGDLQGLHSPL
ncbi:L2HGDH [Symbiodinium sp. CCMP2592]|nr:L2HGDH [Symbiodinium sp. CCMP2592]